MYYQMVLMIDVMCLQFVQYRKTPVRVIVGGADPHRRAAAALEAR